MAPAAKPPIAPPWRPYSVRGVPPLSELWIFWGMDSGPLFRRPKRRLFVSYDHLRDGSRYERFLLLFGSGFDFVRDNSVEREIGTDDAAAHIAYLSREAMAGCHALAILCGPETHRRKFVDWEIRAALEKGLALIAIPLPDCPKDAEGNLALPERFRKNFASGYAVLCPWSGLAATEEDLSAKVRFALERPPELIDNSAPPQAADT
jgi:hypothetical protein